MTRTLSFTSGIVVAKRAGEWLLKTTAGRSWCIPKESRLHDCVFFLTFHTYLPSDIGSTEMWTRSLDSTSKALNFTPWNLLLWISALFLRARSVIMWFLCLHEQWHQNDRTIAPGGLFLKWSFLNQMHVTMWPLSTWQTRCSHGSYTVSKASKNPHLPDFQGCHAMGKPPVQNLTGPFQSQR